MFQSLMIISVHPKSMLWRKSCSSFQPVVSAPVDLTDLMHVRWVVCESNGGKRERVTKDEETNFLIITTIRATNDGKRFFFLFSLPEHLYRLKTHTHTQGDGGGPLVCETDGFFEITGLVSWGFGCGRPDVPAVYVKVSSFIGWINQIISVNNQWAVHRVSIPFSSLRGEKWKRRHNHLTHTTHKKTQSSIIMFLLLRNDRLLLHTCSLYLSFDAIPSKIPGKWKNRSRACEITTTSYLFIFPPPIESSKSINQLSTFQFVLFPGSKWCPSWETRSLCTQRW